WRGGRKHCRRSGPDRPTATRRERRGCRTWARLRHPRTAHPRMQRLGRFRRRPVLEGRAIPALHEFSSRSPRSDGIEDEDVHAAGAAGIRGSIDRQTEGRFGIERLGASRPDDATEWAVNAHLVAVYRITREDAEIAKPIRVGNLI